MVDGEVCVVSAPGDDLSAVVGRLTEGRSALNPPTECAQAIERPEHVSFLFVPVLGLMLGFVTAWSAGAGWLLAALVGYGLFGVVLDCDPNAFGRVIAFIFSAVFVVVTVLGWISWAFDAFRRARTALSHTPENGG